MGNKQSKQGLLYTSLKDSDPELHSIITSETQRQRCALELIASENYTSIACMEGNGNNLTNKYFEGYPLRRYYGGCQYYDAMESLCQRRALEAFNLDANVWGVNVQALSGSPANFAVYAALLKPGDRIMGLKLTEYGHLTHGAITPSGKKLSNSSIFFESRQYSVNPETCLIDYEKLQKEALEFQPKLIIAGASAYPRDYDFPKFREIADSCGAVLMADIAHTAGIVSAGLLSNPFDYCDVVTTTTHKTLRMARGALIFYKLKYKEAIDFSVFPGTFGGAHGNTMSAICTGLRQVNTPEFKDYAKQVLFNARVLACELMSLDFDLLTNGTETHLIMINLKRHGVSGAKFEKIAELCGISLNKNTIPTDTSALNPSGIRIGTPAMTSRGFGITDFQYTARKLRQILELTIRIHTTTRGKKMSDFENNISEFKDVIDLLHREITEYCKKFPLPTLEPRT